MSSFNLFAQEVVAQSAIDDTTAQAVDSMQAEIAEQEFQDDIESLFSESSAGIDTTGWNTKKINALRFDYQALRDTISIILNDPSAGRVFTWPAFGYVTSQFGPRRGYWHFGVDIKVAKGDTVRCALKGMVRVIQYDRYGYGKVVVVRHPDGLETLYGHLSKTLVQTNQELASGDVVGLGGNTGRSTGSHLHFEMRYCGEPFNPNCIADFSRCGLRSDTLLLARHNFDYLTELRKTKYHIVRRGENLGLIARRHGTTVSKLCAFNRIRSRTILSVGRRLIVRKSADPALVRIIEPSLPPASIVDTGRVVNSL